MDSIFLIATIAVIINLCHQYRNEKINLALHFDSLFELSKKFYGFELIQPFDLKLLISLLTKETVQISTSNPNARYSDHFWGLFEIIREYLNSITNIQWPKYEFISTEREQSWNTLDAPLLWEWIHVITFYVDIHAGKKEKIAFLAFIKQIVNCSICSAHYSSHMQSLANGLDYVSLSDSFFILHSSIALDEKYDPKKINLIQEERKKVFFKRFLFIMSNKLEKD